MHGDEEIRQTGGAPPRARRPPPPLQPGGAAASMRLVLAALVGALIAGGSRALREGRCLARDGKHGMYYRVARPDGLAAGGAAPVVVVHGGPGVPSDYLWPLADAVGGRRSVVFFDQLGCGRSDRPPPAATAEGIVDASVRNLEDLLAHLQLDASPFHLYGQSYGGIVAHRFAARRAPDSLLSLALSSSPPSVAAVEAAADELVGAILAEGTDPSEAAEAFRRRHQCRTEELPEALAAAYERAAEPGKGRGSAAIAGYDAAARGAAAAVPSLVTRGEHDFVTAACLEGWRGALGGDVRWHTFPGCSHHGLLEDAAAYAAVFEAFWAAHDPAG